MAVPCRYLLIVDDEESVLHNCRLAVEEANKSSSAPFIFHLLTSLSVRGAKKMVRERYIDCAIIDLRLPNEVGGEATKVDGEATSDNGNKLLLKMLEDMAIPFVVHSAHSGEVQIDRNEYKYEIIDKEGGSFEKIFSLFYDDASLINAMSEIRRDLMRETALLFQKSIFPHWKGTKSFEEGDPDLQKVILRQIASHLAELYSLPTSESPEHHLYEVYFQPPLRSKLHTGDLVRFDSDVYVIVTPQCNIANEYPDHFLLAKCCEMGETVARFQKSLTCNSKTKYNKVIEDLEKLSKQQTGISLHFLPPCGDEGPWFVDFKTIISVQKDTATKLFEGRFASISPQFIPNLVQRFSAYIGRHGQPDMNVEELADYFRK